MSIPMAWENASGHIRYKKDEKMIKIRIFRIDNVNNVRLQKKQDQGCSSYIRQVLSKSGSSVTLTEDSKRKDQQ